jgi:hypothetical protein
VFWGFGVADTLLVWAIAALLQCICACLLTSSGGRLLGLLCHVEC